MSDSLANIRLAFRGLARAPGFAITASLTLALGIGLATAVFTVADAFLLRRLPVHDQDRLVALWGITRDGSLDHFPLLLGDARDFKAQARTLERVEFFSRGGAIPTPMREGGQVFNLRRALVSGGYFDLLGARPVLGRALRPDDDVTGAAPVIVLSHGAWQQRFGGDSLVIGRQLVLHHSGQAHTIVGVMPPGLDYPRGTDFWAAVMPASRPMAGQAIYAELHVLGRLRPGATPADARAELSAWFTRPGATEWQRNVVGVAHAFPSAVLGDVRPAVMAFTAAAALLLLISCINVANLLLVRGTSRVREIAVRSALGAGRARIVRQLLTESALLSAAAAIVGAGLAAAAVRGFVAFAPAGLPRLGEVHVDGRALGVAVAINVLVMLLFAVAPALVTSRVELQEVLRSGTRQAGAGRRIRLGTEALVVGQVALALMVLSAAGLITRSLMKLERVDLAFDPARMTIAELALPFEHLDDKQKQLALLDALVPRVEAIPGVSAVTPVISSPYSGPGGFVGQPSAEGQTAEESARNPMLDMEIITPNYFTMFGIPVVRGRAFTDADREGAPPVVILSESAARHYWPGADPIGKRVTLGPRGNPFTVVGIVPETRYRDLREARPSIYFALDQSVFPVAPTTLAIRTAGEGSDVTAALRAAIREVDASVGLASATPFERLLERPRAQPRLNAALLSAFAAAAVFLAAVGLYGAMAAMVRQRTRELGVRMALGATSATVLRLVLGRGLALAAVGTAAGLAGALVANRLLRAILFDVSPVDVPTLGVVTVLLLAVAVVASAVPARSGARVDPVVALRAD